jgi:hypothetical protein
MSNISNMDPVVVRIIYKHYTETWRLSNTIETGPMRGLGFSRYIGPGPGIPRRDMWISEGPIALAIDVLFWTFPFLGYFQLFLVYLILREVSACPRGPKEVLFRLVKFLLEALETGCEFCCSWRVCWSSSTSDTRHVTLVWNPSISLKRGKGAGFWQYQTGHNRGHIYDTNIMY